MTFWAASGFLWQRLASFIKNKIKQSKNKAMCYHILVFTVLKEQRMASSQKIHKDRCFTFIKGQQDNCLFSKLNLPVLYIPWLNLSKRNMLTRAIFREKGLFIKNVFKKYTTRWSFWITKIILDLNSWDSQFQL